jgi:hypothetical protein
MPEHPERDSHAKRFIDLRLRTTVDTSLDDFVGERRGRTPRVSWRHIARDIYEATGEDLTPEVVRKWYVGTEADAPAEAVRS